MTRFLIVLMLTLLVVARMASANTCVDTVQKNYATKGKHVPFGSDSVFLKGIRRDEISVLIHGFMATPYEMLEAGKRLNKFYGTDVYIPLLKGFGGTAEQANKVTKDEWTRQIKDVVETLGKCYKRINISGMSLGGALATNYVLNDYLPKEKQLGFKIKSLSLFSPYYDVSLYAGKVLMKVVGNVTDKVSISALSTVTQSDDLNCVVNNEQFYNTEMPIKTLPQLFALGESLQNKVSPVKSTIPVQVFITEHDETIDIDLASSLPRTHFQKVEVVKYDKEKRIPHQITMPEVNPDFNTVMLRNMLFLLRHNS